MLRKEFFQFLRVLVDALLDCVIAAVHLFCDGTNAPAEDMKPHDHAIFLPPLSCNLFIPRLIFAALFCPCRHGGNTDGGLLIGGKIQLLYNVSIFIL